MCTLGEVWGTQGSRARPSSPNPHAHPTPCSKDDGSHHPGHVIKGKRIPTPRVTFKL
jgi:hypothetical protein